MTMSHQPEQAEQPEQPDTPDMDPVILHRKVKQLEQALDTSRLIGAAIGILMARRGITFVESKNLLWRISARRNTKVRDLADEIVYNGDLTTEDTAPGNSSGSAPTGA